MQKTKYPRHVCNDMKVLTIVALCMFMLVGNVSAMSNSFMGDGYFSGNLSVNDLVVRSGTSITLAGARFENEGTFTSVDTDFGVHEDGEPTSFFGVYAHNESAWATSNIIMESGEHGAQSVFNIIKNSPLHPFSPNSSGLINQGDMGLFVDHNSHLAFSHYDNITRDVFGNVIYMSGIQRLMMLNDTALYLEEVDLDVNGSATANYFIGDGSLLTNLNKSIINYWTLVGSTLSHTGNVTINGDMKINTTGKLGIGLNDSETPTYPLQVQSQNRLSPALFIKPFEWDSTGDYAIIHLGDVNNYIESEYLQGVKIGSNWGTRIYQGATERVHILSAYTRLFSPDGTPEITLNDGRLDLSGPLNVRDFWWGIDLSNTIGFRIQDGANKERSLIDGVKNKWISPDATNNLTLNNSGIFVTGDLDVVGNIDVTGNLTLTGSVTDDLTLDDNQHFSVADSKIYSSDDNGYFQFGTDGDVSWWDVGNSATRLNINWLGSYLSSPTDVISAQITDSAFAISYSGNEIQIEADSTDTILRSPNGVNKFNINNTGTFVAGGLDVSGDTVITGSLNVTDQTTSSPGFENEIAGSLTIGTAGNVTSANYEYLKLSRWAGDYGGTGLILEGAGNGEGGYYSDFVIDNFWGYMRIFTDDTVDKNIVLQNVGAGDMSLGINTNPSATLDVNGSVHVEDLIKLSSITLPTCNSTYAGSIGRNSTKFYACDGSIWNGLY